MKRAAIIGAGFGGLALGIRLQSAGIATTLVEARDREEALALAAAWPSARLGTIEVRPIEETLPPDKRYA